MTLEDAILEVMNGYDTHVGAGCATDEAGEIVRQHFRVNYGVQFPGDDALGLANPVEGDRVIFLPLDVNPPADRPKFGTPVYATVSQVVGPNDCHRYPGFPIALVVDDAVDPAKRTRIWVCREEVQIVTPVGRT